MRFDGKAAIVTGGARGIGRAIAERLASEGANVVIGDIDIESGKRTANEIGGRAVAFQLDVTSNDSWQAALQLGNSTFGKIDILVNNAGIAGRSAPAWELEIQDWLEVIAIDLTGVFLGCRTVLPGMIDRGYGRIVNISSIAGKDGNPNASPYSAAKAGVLGLTKSIAKEVATKGVIVNAITPAVIDTDILKQVSEEHIAYMKSRIPMGRVGQPKEVATLAAFLASEDVTFSTGATFDLSGGRATY